MSFLGGWRARGDGDDTTNEVPRVTVAGGSDDGLGAWMRERREERGYDLDRVERDTRIGRGYIEAIEREQFDLLPAPVYARGFVRSYARYLGLEEEEALERMPRELPQPPGLEPLPGLRRREGPAAIPAVSAVPRLWLVVAFIVVVAGAAAFLIGLPRLGDATGDDGADQQVEEVEPAATVGPFEEGTMPDLRNVELAAARRVLGGLGVTVIEFEIETDDTPPGRVFGHSPSPGQPLTADDVVNLFISMEPAPDATADAEE